MNLLEVRGSMDAGGMITESIARNVVRSEWTEKQQQRAGLAVDQFVPEVGGLL